MLEHTTDCKDYTDTVKGGMHTYTYPQNGVYGPITSPEDKSPTVNSVWIETKTTSDKEQIGGNHYKGLPIEPWNYIASNNLGYFEGNVVKYVTRWKVKGGIQDLEKALHYLQKLIDLETRV